MQIKRRVSGQPTGYGVNEQQAQNVKKFNKDLRYVQGFRTPLNSGSNTVTITLNAPGKMLLGVSVIPVSAADITDTQVSFSINNNNVLIGAAASNMNPQYVQGMIYFPTPQPLSGNDTIAFSINKNDVGSINVIINVFYVPR